MNNWANWASQCWHGNRFKRGKTLKSNVLNSVHALSPFDPLSLFLSYSFFNPHSNSLSFSIPLTHFFFFFISPTYLFIYNHSPPLCPSSSPSCYRFISSQILQYNLFFIHLFSLVPFILSCCSLNIYIISHPLPLPSLSLFVRQSVYLSVCLSVCLSVSLSLSLSHSLILSLSPSLSLSQTLKLWNNYLK